MKANWEYYLYRSFWAGLDLLFPPVCGGCGQIGLRWFADCQSKIPKLSELICDVCGLPQAQAGVCGRCEKDRPAFKQLRSWVAFDSPIRKALHKLKYHRDISLGDALAEQISAFVAGLNWPIEIVIPILV